MRTGLAIAALAIGLLVSCATASAASPSPVRQTFPVLVTSSGASLGPMQFEVTYNGTVAAGRVTSNALHLPNAGTYWIRSCVWYKAPGEAPQSTCEERVDKVGLLEALTGVVAQPAYMAAPRPPAGAPAATIPGSVLVDRLEGDRYQPYASSWPAAGMPVAGVPVPAAGQTGGAVLPLQGEPISGRRPGGINTRAPDAICRTETAAGTGPRGSPTALGDLPFPYEVQAPTGKYRSKPVGTMVLLHGGGWSLVGEDVLESMRGEADRWRARGWRTVNSSYRSCGSSSKDILTLYDRVTSVYGTKTPSCALGVSAGGHLALLLAALRPRLACVVAQGAPADLPSLSSQVGPDGSGGNTTLGGTLIENMAVAAFGADRIAQLSPTRLRVKARVLIETGVTDIAVPFAQATEFVKAQKARDKDAYVDVMHLAEGTTPWVHGYVSDKALRDTFAHEKTLVAPIVTPGITASKRVAVRTLRSAGLRVRFSCPTTCSLTVRLMLGGRRIARAKARRSSFGQGRLTVRLKSSERKRAKAGRARLVADVRAGGKRTRKTVKITVRR